jgi:hypothetical protein
VLFTVLPDAVLTHPTLVEGLIALFSFAAWRNAKQAALIGASARSMKEQKHGYSYKNPY